MRGLKPPLPPPPPFLRPCYDSWAKFSITPGIRPLKMPSGQGIRTQKWSNPLLCPVGGRWGMTLVGALHIQTATTVLLVYWCLWQKRFIFQHFLYINFTLARYLSTTAGITFILPLSSGIAQKCAIWTLFPYFCIRHMVGHF